MDTIVNAAIAVLDQPDPSLKIKLTREFAAAWKSNLIQNIGNADLPDQPARNSKPELLPHHKMPKRTPQSQSGRIAFIHAIAHIELNAIDLAWDIIGRFSTEQLPSVFYDDWLDVAVDEARHFEMLSTRLIDLGSVYGDHPAHNGLWEAAKNTSDDIAARLALVPMVLEARGLDTTPKAVQRLSSAGDKESSKILEKIGIEEIPHVATGVRWFKFICKKRGVNPIPEFHRLVEERFRGKLKAPFNNTARAKAQFPKAYYQPLV
jgi:uncharacterized ferritin-like protein (DUF455 family)